MNHAYPYRNWTYFAVAHYAQWSLHSQLTQAYTYFTGQSETAFNHGDYDGHMYFESVCKAIMRKIKKL